MVLGMASLGISSNVSLGNIFTNLPKDFMAALLGFLPTNLMKNLRSRSWHSILETFFAFLYILSVALPVHHIHPIAVATLLGDRVPRTVNRLTQQ